MSVKLSLFTTLNGGGWVVRVGELFVARSYCEIVLSFSELNLTNIFKREFFRVAYWLTF